MDDATVTRWIILIWREHLHRWEVLDHECNEGHSGPYLYRLAVEHAAEDTRAWFADHNHPEPRVIVVPLEVPS